MKNKEIQSLWEDLVVRVGATKPIMDGLNYIYLTWCPDNTYDAKFLTERRPELKEILRQSLAGELSKGGFNSQITTKIEFKRLMNEVHQNIAQIDDKELFKWSSNNIEGVNTDNWSVVGPESKRHLQVSLSRYFTFEMKINELNNKMKNWMQEYKHNLKNLEELAEKNPQYTHKKQKEELDLSKKRLNDVVIIQSKLLDLIDAPTHGLKHKMGQEVYNAIFSGSILSEIPDWASEIDAVKMRQNMIIMNKIMEIEPQTPRNEIDKLLADLEKIMNGPVEEILMKLSKLNLTEFS